MRKLLSLGLAFAVVSGFCSEAEAAKPYNSAAGNYRGTFHAPGALSGGIHLTITPSGVYTGKVLWCGYTRPFRGECSQTGTNQVVLGSGPSGTPAFTVQFALDPAAGTTQVSGTIQGEAPVGTAPFVVSRRAKGAARATHGITRYTSVFLVPDEQGSPMVYGFATMKITGADRMVLQGKYGFGSVPFVASAQKDVDNVVRFYTPINMRSASLHSAVSGELVIEDNTISQVAGPMHQVIHSTADNTYETGELFLIGSKYEHPKGNGPLLPTLTASGGPAEVQIRYSQGLLSGTVSVEGHKVIDPDKGLKMIFNPATGAFHGTLWNGLLEKFIPIRGVAFQAQDAAWGCYTAVKDSAWDAGQVSLLPLGRTLSTNANPIIPEGSSSGGAYGFSKTGSGVLTLSSSNQYVGGTVVANGTLSPSSLVPGSGATLSGCSSFTSSLEMNYGEILAVGPRSVLLNSGTLATPPGSSPMVTGTLPSTSGSLAPLTLSEQDTPVANW